MSVPHLPAAPHGPPPVPPTTRLQSLIEGGPAAWLPLLGSLAHILANLAVGIVILLITLWLAERAARLTRRSVGRLHAHGQPDAVLQGFAASLVRYLVVVIGLIAVLGQLGVKTTSLLAVLGAASLAIGLALQGGLSNVAAGVMILLLRPYRMGDRVEIAGKIGKVHGLDLFMTRVHDLDNSVVFIPNSKALGDVIVNYSLLESRRIVMDFGIDYEDDVDLALELLLDVARRDPRVVADPAPWAKVTALNDSTVTVTLRAWTSPNGYVDTRFDLIREVKRRFEEAGLSFPYPHQVAVETRPFTPPDRERQRRALEALRNAGAGARTGPASGENCAEGSTSEKG